MSASFVMSETLKGSIQRSSCPAFGALLRKDAENLDSSESDFDEKLHPSCAVGSGGWFEEHVDIVGAPRPFTRPPSSRTPEAEGRRQVALEKVHLKAELYRAKLEARPTGMKGSRSEPDLCSDLKRPSEEDLETSISEQPVKSQGNTGSKSLDLSCLDGLACCQWSKVVPKWVISLRRALLNVREGSVDPGFSSRKSAVIIFDWDDTLMPTTYVLQTVIPSLPESERAGVLPKTSQHQAALAAHAHLVGFLLRTARRVARVAIVSNSLSPWVEASAARYLPGLDMDALLEELEVPIYYARRHVPGIPVNYKVQMWQIYIDRASGGRIGVDIVPESDGSLTVARIEDGGLMHAWNQAHPSEEVLPGDQFTEVNGSSKNLAAECRKLQALAITVVRAVPDRDPYVEAKRLDMVMCLDKFYAGHADWRKNVLSIGDASTEQEAIKQVLHDRPSGSPDWQASSLPLCKTVNLIDHPSLEQLSNELRILLVWLSRMVEYDKDFDLSMDGLDDLEAKLFKA
eukprot:TRINITY_DN29159_c0_g1_i1.p1 TRINITY_DN29159_c0_g1~~TRINITY_DN29159_c0_g1_i1.p1  ORF type:complete len:537 (-),score=86.74 TRINITY_DN29159_c0_g1_i1:5-1549(-)